MDNDRGKDVYPNQPDQKQGSPQSSVGPAGSKAANLGEKKSKFEELNWTEAQKSDSSEGPKVKIPRSRFKIALLIIAAVLVLMLAAAGTYVMAFYSEIKETQRVLLDEAAFDQEYDIGAVFPEHIVNIGMLGFDRGWNREAYGEYMFRPDMLAVFTINFETDEISVVRIPRDSYVPIYGMGGFHDKINHSYYNGYRHGGGEDNHADGIRYTLHTVSNVLGGIPIHYYISVDMYSVIELVDAMGGIYYEVEEEIIDKHWEIGRVLVPEGPQLMDGKTFLRYLQYRDNKTSQDYGRIDRQMNLLKETFYYLREKGRITDIPATYRIYKDYVETDLSYTQIAAMAYYGRDVEVTDENLHFYTLQGSGQMKDGIWYQVLNQKERVQVIKEVFGIDAEPWRPIVLKDSPEYLEEQERKRLEEEREKGLGTGIFRDGLFGRESDDNEANLIEVPDLRGMTIFEAGLALRKIGLVIGRAENRYDNFLDNGQVIHSEPIAGSLIKYNSEVNLFVSKGQEQSN